MSDDIVVVDNGQTYETSESAIVAKNEADRAEQWAKYSEEKANLASDSATSAATSRDAAASSAQSAANTVNGFDAHAAEKQSAFDTNAAQKTQAFNDNAQSKTNTFNTNAAQKQAAVDASAENARKWAVGTIQEQPSGSARYWAENAKAVTDGTLNETQITNCITKIPQDIKLELSNGTLTLKAGSKVYVPNGSGKFNVVTISNDLSSNSSLTTNKVMLVLNKNYNGLYSFVLENQYSGTTEPSNPNTGTIWYDTTNNLIKRYSGTSWESGVSFPICIANMVSGTGNKFKSIDQVFNGFGYIGSTVFALPGVKGLIPNGRNTDGTLRNFEFTTSNVLTYTYTSATGNFNGFSAFQKSQNNNVFLSYDSLKYWKYNENKNMFFGGSSDATGFCYNALLSVDGSGKITSFAPKTPFHAVDYSEYAEADAQNVKLTGNQTINGRKTFNGSGVGIIKSGSAIDIQNTAVDLSVTDGSVHGTSEIHFIDKNGIVQGIFEHQNRTNGDSVIIMAARNHANTSWKSIEVGFDKNDNVFAKAPTPPMNNNDSNIATTSWVRQYGAQLNYSAAITISGTGVKTASVNGVLIGTPIYTNRSEQLKIIIGGKTFFFAPGNSGEDNNHMSQCYLPVAKGQSYNVVEINNNVQLLLVPYV